MPVCDCGASRPAGWDKCGPCMAVRAAIFDPKTTDYCGSCGESPGSGSHVFDHDYVPPGEPNGPDPDGDQEAQEALAAFAAELREYEEAVDEMNARIDELEGLLDQALAQRDEFRRLLERPTSCQRCGRDDLTVDGLVTHRASCFSHTDQEYEIDTLKDDLLREIEKRETEVREEREKSEARVKIAFGVGWAEGIAAGNEAGEVTGYARGWDAAINGVS